MWSWDLILIDGALGALMGGIGWLMTRRLHQRNRRAADFTRMLLVAIGIAMGTVLVAPLAKNWKARREAHAAGLAMYGNERAAARTADVFLPLMQDPKLPDRMRAAKARWSAEGGAPIANSQQTGFAELTNAGLARLSYDDLQACFDVKRALAELVPDLCAGFWTGKFQPTSLSEGIKRLNESQQLIWITVTGRAAALELQAEGPAPRIARAVSDQAIADLMQSLTPEALAVFTKTSAGETPPPAEACLAFRALADGIKTLPIETRETIIRTMNNPNLVGP